MGLIFGLYLKFLGLVFGPRTTKLNTHHLKQINHRNSRFIRKQTVKLNIWDLAYLMIFLPRTYIWNHHRQETPETISKRM